MAIMLTGGAGFIGLNIAERLIDQGDSVVLYGLEAPPDAFMQAVVGKPGHLHIVIGDVRDRTALISAMAEHKDSKAAFFDREAQVRNRLRTTLS